MLNNLLTLKQFNELYPAFTIGGLRALIFNAETNGFNEVIIHYSPTGKRGKILIDVEKFFTWLINNNKGGITNDK